MTRRRQYRGSGRQGGYTSREREAIPTAMFLKPETRSWPVGDRRHVTIALQYMQRGFGNRQEYPKLISRLLQIWNPDQHPDVMAEVEEKLPSIAEMMDRSRARRNPTPLEAEVQRMLDDPPVSWQIMMERYGLSPGVSPDRFYGKILEFTPSMARSGAKGRSGYVPPEEVRRAALLGLRLSFKHNYTSASGIGVARAVQLALAPSVDERTISRMSAYFSRHRKDQASSRFGDMDNPSRGFMAWLNWGGTPGWEWARQQLGVAQPNPRHSYTAEDNPEVYTPEIDLVLAGIAIEAAAEKVLKKMKSTPSTVRRSMTYRLEDIIYKHEPKIDDDGLLKDKPAKLRRKQEKLSQSVAKWVNKNLGSKHRRMFMKQLEKELKAVRQRARGIMALHPSQRSGRELMLIAHEIEEGSSLPQALSNLHRNKISYRFQEGRPPEWDMSEDDVRRRDAAFLLGYYRLPPHVFEEPTNWVCSAEPDEDKCRHVELEEKAPEGREWYMPTDRVKYVKEPLWWYNLDVVPKKHQKKVRKRLGEDWVYKANQYDVRSFLPDIASAPKETLAWMEERQPSRRAVQKGLRHFVRALPVKHDFSQRPVPQWVRDMGGRHVKNERDLRIIGRPNRWCFGSVHAAKYLSDLEEGFDLYFLKLNDKLTAVWVNRQEQAMGRAQYQDEIGPFILKEAKYPGNDEAINDLKNVLDDLPTVERIEREKKTRRGLRMQLQDPAVAGGQGFEVLRNPDVYSPEIEYAIAKLALRDAIQNVTKRWPSYRNRMARQQLFRLLADVKKAKTLKGRYSKLNKIPAQFFRDYPLTDKAKQNFLKNLKDLKSLYHSRMRGVMALPDVKRSVFEASPEADEMSYEEFIEELVGIAEYESLADHLFADDRSNLRSLLSDDIYDSVEHELAQEQREFQEKLALAKRRGRAARALGYTKLPNEVLEEPATWVCAAEPDPEKCFTISGDEEGDDELKYYQWMPTRYARDGRWWYNIDVVPREHRREVRRRLGQDWVYLANKHDVRSFLPDIAAEPEKTLAWMEERSPSRKAVQKGLRHFVRDLPPKHDFSSRPIPQWVQEMGGRHVLNERDLRTVGRPNGWCFGSQFAHKYLGDLEDGFDLYFLTLNDKLTAVWVDRMEDRIRRGNQENVFEDEVGRFYLWEAKYPHNEEAIFDLKEILAHRLRSKKKKGKKAKVGFSRQRNVRGR